VKIEQKTMALFFVHDASSHKSQISLHAGGFSRNFNVSGARGYWLRCEVFQLEAEWNFRTRVGKTAVSQRCGQDHAANHLQPFEPFIPFRGLKLNSYKRKL